MGKRIKVLVVDDSMVFRTAIKNALIKDPELEIIDTACNAYDARDKILQQKPDVMTLDVQMPRMNGIEFLKILMPQMPIPVIVVSAVDGIVFEAMRAGAVDFVAKPSASTGKEEMNDFFADLAQKIRAAAAAKLKQKSAYQTAGVADKGIHGTASRLMPEINNLTGVIAIGASTGGTEATSAILRKLPRRMPGIVVTQHMPPNFTRLYAERLDRECMLSVKEAEDGDLIRPGCVYIAPGDKQMTVVKKGTDHAIHCVYGEKVSGHCPSVDVLFTSMAKAVGKQSVGIILTGMGSDGAKGLKLMRDNGAFTIGQDKKSSVVYGMPMQAYNNGAVVTQSSLDNIPHVLMNYLMKR